MWNDEFVHIVEVTGAYGEWGGDKRGKAKATKSKQAGRRYIISIMVKSKELKIMRKKLEKAEKIQDPFKMIGQHSQLLDATVGEESSPSSASSSAAALTISYKSSADLDDSTLQQCLALFKGNMGDLYRNSTWGLDMEEKKDEFQHKKARFLLLTAAAEAPAEASSTNDDTNNNSAQNQQKQESKQQDRHLAAFVHFRFCYDDDEEPECVVLYVYEIQVSGAFRRRGLGRRLMEIIEDICKAVDFPKVMLTVFSKNTAALQFYQSQQLGYRIDESSPSKYNQVEDYEILSKVIVKK